MIPNEIFLPSLIEEDTLSNSFHHDLLDQQIEQSPSMNMKNQSQ